MSGQSPDWYRGPDAGIDPEVLNLARERPGWSPTGWHTHLLYIAASCATNNPQRSAELLKAAGLMAAARADTKSRNDREVGPA